MKKTAQKPAEAPMIESAPEKSSADNADHLTLAEVKELIELVSEKEFNEFELERGSFRLRIIARTLVESNLQAVSARPIVFENGPIGTATAAQSAPAPAPEESLHII